MFAVSIGLGFGAGSDVWSLLTEVSLLGAEADLGLALVLVVVVAEYAAGTRARPRRTAASAVRRNSGIGVSFEDEWRMKRRVRELAPPTPLRQLSESRRGTDASERATSAAGRPWRAGSSASIRAFPEETPCS